MEQPNQESIDAGRRLADTRYSSFTQEEISHLRRKAKTNLFFLAAGILGYTKLTKGLHLEICKWNKSTLAEQFRLKLLPRSHYKSTLDTISDSIQIILPDDFGDQPYPRNLGTNCRLLISHETSEAASRFLNSITQHFCTNPLLMGLFPECVPNPRQQKINKLELELPRSAIWSEPTIDTVGVAGKSQGRHYNFIKCDDIYGAAARDSKAERESTILWVDNLQSLLISPRTDHIDFIGTRWAHDDAYAHIKKVYGDRLKEYIRSCEEDEINEKGKKTGKKIPIFPEEFSPESLQILKKNRVVWNAQYANNPYEGGSRFQEEWLRYYNWTDPRRKKELIIFTGREDEPTRKVNVGELDVVILIDPAMVGLSGIVVTGTDDKMNIYVLDAIKKELETPEFVNLLFELVQRWNPRLVVIEKVLFSGLYEHYLPAEMILRGRSFKIEQVTTGKAEKDARVMGLSNYFAAGQIYFNQGMIDLIEEFREFGASSNYHMLDAMAQGTKKTREGRPIWRAAVKMDRINMYKEAENKLLEGRDPVTGYGSY